MLDLLQRSVHAVFGSPAERKIKKIQPLIDEVAHFEAELSRLSDEQLQAKTAFFKQEIANRAKDLDPKKDFKLLQDTLDLLLPEAFAVVREASKRVLGMRHFDVQLLGGYVLHKSGIAEMRTGEGKTLVATLPAYLNALTGKGVHIITVNDYLARRDAEWMGQLFNFLGLSVGMVLSEQRGLDSFYQKRQAYRCDITYGTNNEFGFDYLRDNMATSRAQRVQRPFYFAVVDEVDSILIDEARTPLIISGRLEQSAETYVTMAKLAPSLQKDEDYTVDEKARNVVLTEEGIDKAQSLLGVEDLFDYNTNLAHHLLCALKAQEIFKRDVDYVVKNNEIVIVDEFTGRLMEGRRWSDGQHQAVEAKEGVRIQDETQTLASITFQNLFRLYPKLAGMTGTALTEEAEFGKIYNLEVTAMPTNKVDLRKDGRDLIFKNEAVKFFQVVESLIEVHLEGRPVLIGTTSIEKSEYLSHLLTSPQPLTEHLNAKAQRCLAWLEGQNKAEWSALLPVLQAPQNQTPEQWEALQSRHSNQSADLTAWLESLGITLNALWAVKKGIPHQVLNAKHHEQEALIIAQAGRKSAVTIATNMAGRGTDILLGGNPELMVKAELLQAGEDWRSLSKEDLEARIDQRKTLTEAEKAEVTALGGLHIIGTERHESRRIDNQLRGRAARQGDPGSSQFFLSLEDSLMRLFGGNKIASLMDFLAVDETLPITAPFVNGIIEGAQRKVEAYHFDIRKNVLQYDDVLTEQRKLIYAQRQKVLDLEGLQESVAHMIEQELTRTVAMYVAPNERLAELPAEAVEELLRELGACVAGLDVKLTHDEAVFKALQEQAYPQMLQNIVAAGLDSYQNMNDQLSQIAQQIQAEHGVSISGLEVEEEAELQENGVSEDDLAQRRHPLRKVERELILGVVDSKWIEFLHNLDALREGIGLRAYGQKDPLIEYKREAYDLFQQLTYDIRKEVVSLLFRSQIQIQIQGPQPDIANDFNDTAKVSPSGY